MYKQMNTMCKPTRIRLFALITNCTIIMKTKSRFSPIYQWQWKVIERTSSMLDTPPQDTLHKDLHIFNACQHSCTEYDLKVIMYPVYDTPHKLCNIRGNQTIQQPRLPPNNAGRPVWWWLLRMTRVEKSPVFVGWNIGLAIILVRE